MSFGIHHYVPVLKVKLGEKQALADLAPSMRQHVTPLLEVVERNSETPLETHLHTAFTKLRPAVAGLERYFIDTREIAADGPIASGSVYGRCLEQGVAFTPVTGLTRPGDVATGLRAKGRNGIALRVARSEFEQQDVPTEVTAFLKSHRLSPDETDFILDLGAVDDMVEDGVAEMARAFLHQVPEPRSWRTLSLIGCAFPLSMKLVARDSHAHTARMEWNAWRDSVYLHASEFARVPTFGDCVIQHTKGVEGFNPKTMQGSAAIRYALGNEWLLLKGRGTRKASTKIQMPKLARELVAGGLRVHFRGPDHCAGCRRIQEAAGGAPGAGSLMTWRRIGTVHHITTTVEAIQRLHAP